MSAIVSASLDAERALIGSSLVDPRVLSLVDLEPGDFFDPKHQMLWNALQSLQAASKPIDPVSVLDELGARSGAIGGLSGVTGFLGSAGAPSAASHHAARIREHAVTRRVHCELAEIRQSDLEGEELLAAVQAIGSRVANRQQRGRAKTIGEWVRAAYKQLDEDAARGVVPGWHGRGLSTGLEPLDQILGGIKLGVLTVLAGRPSHGKSALARNIAEHLTSHGIGVHVFSLEDSGTAYAMRAMAEASRINLAKFSSLSGWNAADMRKLREGSDALWKRKSWVVDDVSGLSSREIGIRVRLQREDLKTQLVIVDYVGHMHEPAAKAGDDMATITQATKGLFHLARTEGVAVLMLSQLSRKVEDRANKQPLLSDLRQSGEIEQDAECVMFTHRQSQYEDNPVTKAAIAHEAEVIVRKNKNGLTGVAKLHWDGASTSFRNPGGREQ